MAKKGFGGLSELRGKVPDVSAPKATHADLEAAIAANPDDRELYRVYADALERAGDPRGPFIALHDADLRDEIAAYLEEHRDYLLGSLAPAVHPGTISITWVMGFISAITIARAPLAELLVTLDTIANLPSCRFVRTLNITPQLNADVPKILAHLAALARPTTLAELSLDRHDWSSSEALLGAFPRLRAVVDELDARLRSSPPIGHHPAPSTLPRFPPWALARRIAPTLRVDASQFEDARVCAGGSTAFFTIPPRSAEIGALVIDGDAVIEGVLEQADDAVALLVLGSLTCGSLCTESYLVVTGDLVVRDVFYGNTAELGTVVLGNARIATMLSDSGHSFDAGSETVDEIYTTDDFDEVDDWVVQRGLPRERGARAIAAGLRGNVPT